MSTIFTQIIAGEIPCFKVYEDEVCIVIMDKYPAVVGQSMVILKREAPYIFDLADTEYHHLFTVAQKVAIASDKVFEVERSCLVVEGFEIPHVHVKIYPMPATTTSLGNVMCERAKAHDEDLSEYAARLAQEIN